MPGAVRVPRYDRVVQRIPQDDDQVPVHVGDRWPFGQIPPGVTFGWHRPHTLLLSDAPESNGLPWKPDESLLRMAAHGSLRLGLAQHGPIAFLLAKMPGWDVVEAVRPWFHDEDPPELTLTDGEHVVWKLAVTQDGIIVNLRAFTTSPFFTRQLRRVYAEQRAHGPITPEEVDPWLYQWRTKIAPDGASAWKRVIATSLAGD